MSLLGVEISVLAGPIAAALIAAQYSKEKKPESLTLSDTALLLFALAFLWLIFAGFWHIALGGRPADFLLAHAPRFKYRFYVYAMYCAFSASLSLWCICAWQWLQGLGKEA